MSHRHIYNTSQMFEAEPDQDWNRPHSEEQYLHFARTHATENGPSPIFHSGDNASFEHVYYGSQRNVATSSNGYSSSALMTNPRHFQPDTSDLSRDPLHQPATPNVCVTLGNHTHLASSSNYALENNYFDLSVGHGRGPYKRKSPGTPMSERGSTSRYYCSGSSSDISSLPNIRQEKPSLDPPHNHWEPWSAPSNYRASHHSTGGESSVRNVRSRSSIDLESDAFRTHRPANYSDRPSSSRLPVDHPGPQDHSNPNASAPLPEWAPAHISGAPLGRMVPSNLGHDSSHFFSGSIVTHSSRELTGYNQEQVSGRNSLGPPGMHSIPSHTRGVRSNYTHRSSPNSRVSMGNVRMGHMVPPNDGMQLLTESHSSGHLRPFGPAGWRNGDRNGRSRLSERYRLFTEDASPHEGLTPEGLMIVDHPIYGSRNMLDHHRDMRLDVDNMSYEDLLALGERIGSVSTGVCQDQLQQCLTETVYCSSDQNQEEERCVICLDEYQHMDDVGTLKSCGHEYHVSCIKKWLSLKNLCPICKGPAMPESTNDKQV